MYMDEMGMQGINALNETAVIMAWCTVYDAGQPWRSGNMPGSTAAQSRHVWMSMSVYVSCES